MSDFLQSASNAVAGNVSGPVDLIAAALRMMGVPVQEPVGGSAWMERQGLTKPVKQSAKSVAGETAGLLLGPLGAAKAPQIAKGLLTQADEFQRYNQALGPAGAPLATVWHGSPHKFDKFDSSKIGTGEGAQAYGHGLYLADAEPTGREYAWQLSQRLPDRIKLAGKPVPSNDMLGRALEDVALLGKPAALQKIDDAIAFNEKYAPDMASLYRSLKEKIAQVDPAAVDVNRGNLYKVDLPDSAIAKMLDWDAPLSKQAALAPSVAKNPDPLNGENWLVNVMGSPIDAFPTKKAAQAAAESMTGMDLVKHMNAIGSRAGTDAMRQAGIPGIKYLDGVSRGAGQGTRNYVVFPGEENILTILERNGVSLP